MGNTLMKGHNINFEDIQFAINEHKINKYQTHIKREKL